MIKKYTLIFIMLIFSHVVFSDSEIIKIDKNVQELFQLEQKYQYSNRDLFWIQIKLHNVQNLIQKYLKKQHLKFNQIKLDNFLISKKTQVKGSVNYHLKYLNMFEKNRENIEYLEFIQSQIEHEYFKISMIMHDNYKKSLFIRQQNLFKNFKIISTQPSWPSFDMSFKHYLLSQSFIFMPFQRGLIVFFLVFGFQILQRFNLVNIVKHRLSVSQMIGATSIFLLTNPILFHALVNTYDSSYNSAILVYKKLYSIYIFIFLTCYIYDYKFKQILHPIDKLWILFGFIILIGLLYIGERIFYLNLQASSLEVLSFTLFWKYLFFLLLMCLTIISLYLIRVYLLSIFPYHRFIEKNYPFIASIILGMFGLIFVVGIIGFLNLAMAVWCVMMLSISFILWIFILIKSINLFFKKTEQKKNQSYYKYLFNRNGYLIMDFIFLKNFYIVSLIVLICSVFWLILFLPDIFYWKAYNAVFQVKTTLNEDFILVRVLWGIFVFMVLNFINRFSSVYLAKKVTRLVENQQKYEHVFFIMGFFIAILIAIECTGINIKNLGFIIGGISFGLGIGLTDLVGNFIAGVVILFVNPIAKGHYVIIEDTQGFVKKIDLMNTEIESFDKVSISIPNLKILKSVLKDYSARTKLAPRFHFKFVLTSLADVPIYQKIILSQLAKNEQVVLQGESGPEFLVLPAGDLTNNQQLELDLTYSVHDIQNLLQVISNLTLNFNQAFEKANINVLMTMSGIK